MDVKDVQMQMKCRLSFIILDSIHNTYQNPISVENKLPVLIITTLDNGMGLCSFMLTEVQILLLRRMSSVA